MWLRPTSSAVTCGVLVGASAVCSYGLVSNVNYCITVMIAWVISAKKTGLSPLAPGQVHGTNHQ